MFLYDVEEIERVHKNQNYILKVFNQFCSEHNIHYTLDYGTMLGSVRHKGFIPWDDDIDIAMLRSDYDKFLNLAGNHLNENLFIQTYESDPGFIHSFARIRLNDSLALQEDWKNLQCHHGIFIDIFPYDTIPKDTEERIKHEYLIHIIQEAKLYRVKMKNKTDLDKDIIVKESPLSLLPLHTLNKYQTSIITKYNDKFKEDDLVTHMTQGFKSYVTFQRSVREHKDTINATFEGDCYPIPRTYDRILTKVYGNYKKLPKKENRVPHHGVIKYKTRTNNSLY